MARYGAQHPVVVPLGNGGVPIAREVARALDTPLDWVEVVNGRPGPMLQGRVVIVVADQIVTIEGTAAVLADLRAEAPARIVLAVPVAPRQTVKALAPRVDHLV